MLNAPSVANPLAVSNCYVRDLPVALGGITDTCRTTVGNDLWDTEDEFGTKVSRFLDRRQPAWRRNLMFLVPSTNTYSGARSTVGSVHSNVSLGPSSTATATV